VDAEYLLSNLYGLSTGIRGFDELFGGGGVQLNENLSTTSDADGSGRIIVIKGQFGTGKTLLALQLGVEVARKGGVVLAVPLEQTAREAVYVLESMGCLPEVDRVSIAHDQMELHRALERKTTEHGVVAFLEAPKNSYRDFLTLLVQKSKHMQPYPLRMLIVDPTNSICGRTNSSIAELRADAACAFEAIREMGTNVILVSEKTTDPENEFGFEENIADTVIHLSTREIAGYTQRRFEIVKSRFQREHRGTHPFSILAGIGIRIYPSSASVLARIQSRAMRVPSKDSTTSFGLPSMDKILGAKAIALGDVIVFKGPRGSMKTPLGILFLLGCDQRKDTFRYQSLIVSAKDSEGTIRHMLDQPFVALYQQLNAPKSKSTAQLRICAMPSGHINPGYVFQRLEDEFSDARKQGLLIDRVMVDSISHWEMSCPVIRGDETFADTLLEFLRRQNVTSLLVCGTTPTEGSFAIQRSVIDGADCTIDFDRIEFRGIHRIMIRALKTRSMNHRRESFELTFTNNEIQILPTTSLLRIGRGGEAQTVSIMLFLHSETDAQKHYNDSFCEAVKAVLSPNTHVVPQDRIYMSKVMTLGPTSVVDELQVMQLDEFQLPRDTSGDRKDIILHYFDRSEWRKLDWGEFRESDYLGSLGSRCWLSQARNQFFAVPFYENISFLAYRTSIPTSVIASWQKLATACKIWETKNSEGIFFDYPKGSSENSNCLFLEILLSLQNKNGIFPIQLQCLLKLLHSNDAVRAAELFRVLCRRSYIVAYESASAERGTESNGGSTFEVSQSAMVWRHWYSTLNQMMSKLPPSQRADITVCPLPGGIVIAGEWYLGIPAYSAAPDVGLDIIRLLTSREAELNRLRLGVGLPTRKAFYETGDCRGRQRSEISPFFSFSYGLRGVQELLRNAFRRSDFHCYRKISRALNFYLGKVLELPEDSPAEIRSRIRALFLELRDSEDFMSSDWNCSRCPHIETKPGLPSRRAVD